MKITDILHENNIENVEQYIEKLRSHLKQNCSQIYNKFYNNSDVYLYHSPDYDSTVELKNKLFKTFPNKKRDMGREEIPPYYHNKMDSYFKDNFGINFRSNSLFTVAKKCNIKDNNPVVFPNDGFQLIASESVKDPFFNIKHCLDSEYVQNTIFDFLANNTEQEFRTEKIDFMTGLLFNLLNRRGFLHSEDYPNNVEEFKKAVEHNSKVSLGIELEDISISKYETLLNNIVKHCDSVIDEIMEGYNYVKNKTTLKKYAKEPDSRPEIMVYSSHYTLVNLGDIYNYMIDNGYKNPKPKEIMDFLFN
ncbi:hypothetical protein PBI_SCTP2_305 [Salicola phage SCTP-2]|nr:hypothetical protein PBI_SCTP2_305 [Salicola phage SCTP-2]